MYAPFLQVYIKKHPEGCLEKVRNAETNASNTSLLFHPIQCIIHPAFCDESKEFFGIGAFITPFIQVMREVYGLDKVLKE